MYQYGVAHCCCDCQIFYFDNCKDESGFNSAFEKYSGGTDPTFSGTASQWVSQTCTFSGNARYDINTGNVSELGILIDPRGTVTEQRYIFKQYDGSDSLKHTWILKFMYGGDTSTTCTEHGGSSGCEWTRIQIYKDNSKVYDTYIQCPNATHQPSGWFHYSGKTWVLNNDGYIEFWAEAMSSFFDGEILLYQEYSTISDGDYFNAQVEIDGTDYTLFTSMSDGYGYVTAWKPTAGDEDCEYPSGCSYLIANLKRDYPELKIWFTGIQNWTDITATVASSKLNNLEMVARYRQNCQIRFNDSRWVTGDYVTTSGYDCKQLDAIPVYISECLIDVADDTTYPNEKIKLTATVVFTHDSSNYKSVTFTGTVKKNSHGQIDLNELDEIELQPPSGSDSWVANARGYIALSSHTQAKNPMVYAFQALSDKKTISSVNLTWESGYVGFTNVTRFPNSYTDFVNYHPTISTILEPAYSSEETEDLECYHAPTIFRSPVITSCGHYKQIFFELNIVTGELTLDYCPGTNSVCECDSTSCSGDSCGVTYPYSIPGADVISPRGATGLTFGSLTMTDCPDISEGTYNYYSYSFNSFGVAESTDVFYDMDSNGNVTPKCTYPYNGTGTQTYQRVSSTAGRAYIPDEWCQPPTDPETFQSIYYYGGVAAEKGTITAVYGGDYNA